MYPPSRSRWRFCWDAATGSRAAGRGSGSTQGTRRRDIASDERGTTALEYAFIAGLAAILIVAAVTTIGTEVSGLFQSVTSGF